MGATIGVIAVQGDVRQHIQALESAAPSDTVVSTVRTADDIPTCDGLVLPGGESTTISNHVRRTGIDAAIRSHVDAGKPVLATCAGLIIAAREPGDDRIESLDLLDVTIERNAWGRQADSFTAPITLSGHDAPFPGVFIRAPRIADVGDVDIVATHAEEPVAVADGPVVGACFHPELTSDPRLHRLTFPCLETE